MHISWETGGKSVTGARKYNILFGKNGCGKSSLLRGTEQTFFNLKNGTPELPVQVTYLSPERAGEVAYQPNIDNNITTNSNWLRETRNFNQAPQFKQQAAARFNRLEMVTHRRQETYISSAIVDELSRDDLLQRGFNRYIGLLNNLLDEIELVPELQSSGFQLIHKSSRSQLTPKDISSGESELISLGIEILLFVESISESGENLLLMDEPDVHLHPDLQVRLIEFLLSATRDKNCQIIIATHSSPMISVLVGIDDARIAMMSSTSNVIDFRPVRKEFSTLLPVFGSHPLSRVYSASPILLVEGEDDVRIWSQAVRSSEGKIVVHPCPCGSKQVMSGFEYIVETMLSAVYDSSSAFSLKDGDNEDKVEIDLPHVKRLRLECYEAENLLLCDECLASQNLKWNEIQFVISNWLVSQSKLPPENRHKAYEQLGRLQLSDYDRERTKVKDARELITHFLGYKGTWESLVGRILSKLSHTQTPELVSRNSLDDFLGTRVATELVRGR